MSTDTASTSPPAAGPASPEPSPSGGAPVEPAPPEPTVVQVAPASTVELADVPTAPVDSSQPSEQPQPGLPNPVAALTSQVSQDLGDRLKIDPGEISLIQADQVDWPDAGLGCPDPGRTYAAAITPGYRIILEARGQQYTYHTGSLGVFVLCENGRPAP